MKKFNNKGIALFMVMSSILILTTIMMSFTYFSKVNKIRAYNMIDQMQARLAAESGVEISMARLKLYQEIYNQVQANAQLKKVATPDLVNQIWQIPFIYPFPKLTGMSLIQQELINEFQKNSILDGEFQVSIENLGNKININLLRLTFTSQEEQEKKQTEEEEQDEDSKFNIFDQLVTILKISLEEKRESDPIFYNQYSNIDAELLIAILQYAVSDKGTCQTQLCSSAEKIFQQENLEPGHAPLSFLEEINLLPMWSDDLLSLIKNNITTYGVLMIDLDKLTASMLKLLFNKMTDEQITAYFKWKNDAENPQTIVSITDFKNYWVEQAEFISSENFDKIFKNFEKVGITFGQDANLFRITSTGKFNETQYTIESVVSMPVLPNPRQKTTPPNPDQPFNPDQSPVNPPSGQAGSKKKPKYPTYLLNPRIIDQNIK